MGNSTSNSNSKSRLAILVPRLISLTLVSFGIPVVSSADAYKWVDEEGSVHYSQTKPNEDVQIEIIAEPHEGTRTEDSDKGKKQESTPEQEQPKAKEKKEPPEQKTAGLSDKEKKELQEKNCASSRELLNKLQSKRRFRIEDGEGNLKWASNKEHQETIDKIADNVKKFCK